MVNYNAEMVDRVAPVLVLMAIWFVLSMACRKLLKKGNPPIRKENRYF